jgi:hypothetical protein
VNQWPPSGQQPPWPHPDAGGPQQPSGAATSRRPAIIAASVIAAVIAVVGVVALVAGSRGEPSSSTGRPLGERSIANAPCDHYTGANPTWDEFIADLVRYYEVIGIAPDMARETAGQMADEDVRRAFDNLRPGAAAEITTWMCTVQKPATDEELRQIGVDPALRDTILSNQRGFTLWNLLLEVDCEPGAEPDAIFNVTVTPEEAAAKVRETLCP